MCGITGLWNLDERPIDSVKFSQFTDSLAHRGPDGQGLYFDAVSYLGLGHRRLEILGLGERGKQPMSYANERYWIVHNGEIYNFLELRVELEKLGHRFRSNTDTEIILASYLEWGEDCQFRFNGMWAFALWDSRECTLFLSRDRFGVKPLFYRYTDTSFVFASELKAFMTLPGYLRPRFDKEMIAQMKNIEVTERTLLKDVKNLLSGHCLRLQKGRPPRIRKWWKTIDHLSEVPNSFSDQVEQYRELFLNACKIRMRSDVPLGTALSGGLDSSSTLCAMNQVRSEDNDQSRLADNWKRAFVLGYPGTDQDEKYYADIAIRSVGALPIYRDIDSLSVSPDDVVSAIFSFEAIQNAEPSIGPWLIYQEMKRNNVVVSIDGHGGDETLAGYHHYPAIASKDSVFPWLNRKRLKDLNIILDGLLSNQIAVEDHELTYLKAYRSLVPTGFELRERVSAQLDCYPALKSAVLKGYRGLKNLNSQRLASEQNAWSLVKCENPIEICREDWLVSDRRFDHLGKHLYNDFHTTELPRILRNFDRVSMAHGVEVRGPFLDWRLVCYAFSLPSESKLGAGFTKRILREAMVGMVPEAIRTRRDKVGFSSPMNDWYRYGLKNHVLDSVNSTDFLESDIWNGPLIRKFVNECNRDDRMGDAIRTWKFIQAMHLIKSFNEYGKAFASTT